MGRFKALLFEEEEEWEAWSLISVCVKRLGGLWCAVAVDGDDGVFATGWAEDEQAALRSVLGGLPFNAVFQVVDRPSRLSEKVLNAVRSVVAGEGASLGFRFEMAHLPKYSQRVLGFLSKVPVGYVTTYGGLAKAAGGGPRAVGRVMATNPFAPLVPCHRVVRSDFSIGGYGGEVVGEGIKVKRAILQRENRGYKEPTKIRVNDAVLSVFPVGFVRKD